MPPIHDTDIAHLRSLLQGTILNEGATIQTLHVDEYRYPISLHVVLVSDRFKTLVSARPYFINLCCRRLVSYRRDPMFYVPIYCYGIRFLSKSAPWRVGYRHYLLSLVLFADRRFFNEILGLLLVSVAC